MPRRWIAAAEMVSLATLLAWLLWLPLPFGSNIPAAWLPLIGLPLVTAAVACGFRYMARRDQGLRIPSPWAIWAAGAAALIAVGLLQLIPLPPGLSGFLSPQSRAIWSSVAGVSSAFGVAAPAAFPLSVDPSATAVEVVRLIALLAAFVSGSLLIRDHRGRVALAVVLCGAAAFQIGFGIREATLQRYEIWGWHNLLVHSRITGTFVNPNHFAHYLALVLPMTLFLAASAWREAAPSRAPIKRRLIKVAENHLLTVGLAVLTAGAISGTVLLSRSRGAQLAMVTGLVIIAALVSRRSGARIGYGAAAAAFLVLGLVLYLGPSRTVERFRTAPGGDVSFAGRRVAFTAAAGVWQRFPVVGSGLGTFQSVVAMEQSDHRVLYHRAHNDYAEIAATGGAIGLAIALVSLFGGYIKLLRMTVGRGADGIAWKRRAFQVAALASLTIAMVHGLIDFNFFIPSNPATLAVIVGAAVAPLRQDIRTRR